MNKKEPATTTNMKNAIQVTMDANFFFEKAVQSLDRHRYDKALKYFHRAAEFEPDNPVNHCNLAGVYSELDNYEESNRILQRVLNQIDPGMTECHFYMANNYANMEQFERAEQSLIQYLEQDTVGQFLEESEEMMEILSYELERPSKITTIKSRENLFEHDQARMMLEDGRFAQASKLLEKIIRKQPNFLAARNNLALAYYYLGEYEKCLFMIHHVLDMDAGNLHALCNLAIFLQSSNKQKKQQELHNVLRKIVPFHQEHVFKLATTMGMIGDHECAYQHFRRLLRSGWGEEDTSLYHYTAVAAYNRGKHKEAKQLWEQLHKLDPTSIIASFYVHEWEQLNVETISYHYHLPHEEVIQDWDNFTPAILDKVKHDPFLRASLNWALYQGIIGTKLQVIQALGNMADEQAQCTLKQFILEADEDDYVKKVAIFVLRSMGASEPIEAHIDGKVITLDDQAAITQSLPVWEQQWQEIIEIALANMSGRYDLIQQHDLQTLWIEYLGRVFPQVPRMTKLAGWSAALEYLTAKMHSRPITLSEVSERYQVSISTIRKNIQFIDEACGLREKMHAILKPYGR